MTEILASANNAFLLALPLTPKQELFLVHVHKEKERLAHTFHTKCVKGVLFSPTFCESYI